MVIIRLCGRQGSHGNSRCEAPDVACRQWGRCLGARDYAGGAMTQEAQWVLDAILAALPITTAETIINNLEKKGLSMSAAHLRKYVEVVSKL